VTFALTNRHWQHEAILLNEESDHFDGKSGVIENLTPQACGPPGIVAAQHVIPPPTLTACPATRKTLLTSNVIGADHSLPTQSYVDSLSTEKVHADLVVYDTNG